jgi:ZIP family zinc transporter
MEHTMTAFGLSEPVLVVILLTAFMGFCTYLALPFVRWGRFLKSRYFTLFNAIGLGILVFLIADIFVDVSEDVWPNDAILADFTMASIFLAGTVVAFLIPWLTEGEEGDEAEVTADRTAFAVALGIGFQNLTEGLAFGAAWALGEIPLAAVILVGYSVQNMTEGFPIVAAYFGTKQPGLWRMIYLFFLRGIPTVIGGVVGFAFVAWTTTYQSMEFDTVFNAFAIGACLYCILPILTQAFQPAETPVATTFRRKLVYWGILVGFALGFACNMI